jgi:hypothetical protein
MVELIWAFENARVRDAGALPPEQLSLDYGVREPGSRTHRGHPADPNRLVTPAACGPVRVISRYGFVVRCPGELTLRRLEQPARERVFEPGLARFGLAEISGTPWPIGDTGLVAGWISGSEYVKIQTGVMILFPADVFLYQGPLPNSQLIEGYRAEVMAGLEYPNPARVLEHEGRTLNYASINVITRLPEIGEVLHLHRGDPLCWLFAVQPIQTATLRRMTT